MKHTSYNRIPDAITPDMMAGVTDAIHSVSGTLPFLIGLTDEERRGLTLINVGNKVFVEDAVRIAAGGHTAIPAYFDGAAMAKKLSGFVSMDDAVKMVGELYHKLLDTQAVLGSGAYIDALNLYHMLESAARHGVAGAEALHTQLGERFKGQGKAKNSAADRRRNKKGRP